VKIGNKQGPQQLSSLQEYKRLAALMGIKMSFFIIQATGAFLVAIFDGLSLGMLIPLAKGVIEKDFSFLMGLRAVKSILEYFPSLALDSPDTFLFLAIIGIIFFSSLLKNGLRYAVSIFTAAQGQKYLFNLLNAIFNRYLVFGKQYFDKTSQGQMGQMLTFSTEIVRTLDVLATFFIKTFTIIVYFFMMFLVSWQLTLLSTVLVPITMYSLRAMMKRMKRTSELNARAEIQLNREVFNILPCIAVVKAYGGEDKARKKFLENSLISRKLRFSLQRKTRLTEPLQETIMLTALLFLISAVALQFVKGQGGQVSGYLVFFVLARRSFPLFGVLNYTRARLAMIHAPRKKILDIFDDKGKFIVPDGTKDFHGLQNKIEIRSLTFGYEPDRLVLRNVSFQIGKGETVAIVGPTGSGKTTILHLLVRLYDCPAGSIFVDGTDIREFRIQQLREHIALVSQDVTLFNETLRNNIIYGARGPVSESMINDAIERSRLKNFIDSLPKGLDTEVGDRGVKLSGGEKQRVAIARALLRNAEILILDEATSSLDSNTERLIQEAIEEVMKERTTIVVAHRLATIRKADRIAVIVDGKIAEEGTLQELLSKKGAFYQAWQEQKFF